MFVFFLEMPKIWVGWTTPLNGEKSMAQHKKAVVTEQYSRVLVNIGFQGGAHNYLNNLGRGKKGAKKVTEKKII